MLTESLKMTCARSYAWLLDFLSNGVGWDCFLQFENLYITSHGEDGNIKFEEQGKPHSTGSFEYPVSEGTDIITPYSRDFGKSLDI